MQKFYKIEINKTEWWAKATDGFLQNKNQKVYQIEIFPTNFFFHSKISFVGFIDIFLFRII